MEIPMRITTAILVLLVSFATVRAAEEPATQPADKPTIEVCFVLDTTGSMSGLIDGAKIKIWAIANEIIRTEPKPNVKIAMIGYRDRNDQYITRAFDMTDDIDLVFKNLQDFKADGGGDGPESVNQALHEAVEKIKWSDAKDVTKIVFLVGDAPPHMDYENDVRYPEVCKLAMKKDLIINTVQCGNQTATTSIWQEIARLAEGSYVAIPQTGGMVAIATPFDEELGRLNVAINATVCAYGDVRQQHEVAGKLALAESAPATVAADRLSFNDYSGKAIQGRGDLIDDLRDGAVKLEDVKKEQLPENLQRMTAEELKAYLAKQAAERAEIQKKVAELCKKRDDFIAAEHKRLAAQTGKADSFDAKVSEMVKQQVARKRS
jgi:Mg-chelatase subunit ChlD